jgi:hypothetical protein
MGVSGIPFSDLVIFDGKKIHVRAINKLFWNALESNLHFLTVCATKNDCQPE